MSVLPSQKLTIGELFVSLAAGLMLFLLPNDASKQIDVPSLAEGLVFINAFLIIAALMFFIKRFQAAGAAILAMSSITVISFVIDIIKGVFTKVGDYWPSFTEYQLVCMFILWTVPFFIVVFMRLFMGGTGDTNESRKSFVRFLSMSIRALMMIYILVIVFEMLIPEKPNLASERQLNFIPFDRILSCLNGSHENGTMYLWWHSLILAPLTFSLLILNPKIKFWHLLIVGGAAGLTIEVIQYSFNTATACLDDIMMYIVGAMVGIIVKRLLDKIRSVLTQGEDKCMLTLTCTPLPRKPLNTPTVLTEE